VGEGHNLQGGSVQSAQDVEALATTGRLNALAREAPQKTEKGTHHEMRCIYKEHVAFSLPGFFQAGFEFFFQKGFLLFRVSLSIGVSCSIQKKFGMVHFLE